MIKLKDILFEGDMDVSSLNLHRTSVGFLDREKIIGYQWDNFQKNYLKLNPRYRIANANDRVYGYKLGEGDAHWMYDPNDGEIYLDDKMVARKVMTGRADKNIFEDNVNESKVDISYTDPGFRFYKMKVDGKRLDREEGTKYLKDLGIVDDEGKDMEIPGNYDQSILDDIVKALKEKGIDADHDAAMDVS